MNVSSNSGGTADEIRPEPDWVQGVYFVRHSNLNIGSKHDEERIAESV